MSVNVVAVLDSVDKIELTLSSLVIEEGYYNTIVINLENKHFIKLAEDLKLLGY